MFLNRIALILVSFGLFAGSVQARTLTDETFAGHENLQSVAQSLQLAEDDWPESQDSVIRHCLQNLKERDQKKPKLSRQDRVQFLDDCAAHWTTVGALKNEYTD